MLQGKNIRYVHIPDDVNIMKTIEQQVEMVTPAGPSARKPKLTAEERKKNVKQEKKNKVDSAFEAMKAQLAQSSKPWTAVFCYTCLVFLAFCLTSIGFYR